jgi:histone H2B
MPAKKSVKAKKGKKTNKKEGAKGGKKRSTGGFSTYILRLIKEIHHGDIGVSKDGMHILESFAQETFDKIAREASLLVQQGTTQTLSSKEAASATRLAIPGDLGRYAAAEAARSMAKYAENDK